MSMDSDKKAQLIKIAFAGMVFIGLIYWFIKHQSSPVQALPAPRVAVQTPKILKMAEYITQTGNTVAFNSVNLVARVEGYLDSIQFTDGAMVKKGQELLIIQPEPYLEQLKEAQATLEAEKAKLTYAEAEYARQQKMYKEKATSLNSVQKWLSNTQESKASVDKAQANVEIAAINYSYTHIKAPFDGRIGRHLVDVGNLVGHAQATNLATIEQINPIYVYFNLSELDLIQVRAAAKAEGLTVSDIDTIPVSVRMQNETGFPHQGYLDFVDTGLDASTGTMGFRALLPNAEHILLPGLFVQVRIATTKPRDQLTVPDTAVLYDQIGPYVLVVDEKNIVVLQRVKLGALEQGVRAVLQGLKAQDQVIVRGLQNATPGNPVALEPPQTPTGEKQSDQVSPQHENKQA